jgi:acyl-CoA thioester hydrolase
MNITWYVSKFDQANWNLFASVSITPSYLRDEKFGVAGFSKTLPTSAN